MTQEETHDEWEQKHEEIARKYSELIERQIPEDILIQGVTVDFKLPSGGQLIIHGFRENGEIKENVFIFAAPSHYSNSFKNARRKFYRSLQRNAFVLGKGQGGRNLYLIPFENIESFMDVVDELREEFRDLEAEINAYLTEETTQEEKEYLTKVREYLEKESGVYAKDLNFKVSLNLKVSLLPLRIDSNTFMNFANDQIREKMKNSLKLLEEEFQKTRESLIHQMIGDLTYRFSEILQKLAKAAETKYTVRYDSICAAVDETMSLAMSVGLHHQIEDLAGAVKATAEVLSHKKIEEKALEMATSEIARALDIESDDPSEILKKATYDLSAMSARAAEVVRRM